MDRKLVMILKAEPVTNHYHFLFFHFLFFLFLFCFCRLPPDPILPVPVDMGCTEGKAIVKKGGVNHGAIFCPFQQVSEVAEMSVTPSDSVSGAILI
jgi:hypothetical protein